MDIYYINLIIINIKIIINKIIYIILINNIKYTQLNIL